MFGLEDQKKGQPEEFVFELEQELQDPKKRKEIKELVESRIQKIKEALRSGEDKENFDEYGILLHGYNAILKVISRIKVKGKG